MKRSLKQLRTMELLVDIYIFFNNNNKILLIRNISNYISFSPQIGYKLIKAGRSRDILQIQGLYEIFAALMVIVIALLSQFALLAQKSARKYSAMLTNVDGCLRRTKLMKLFITYLYSMD